jgi:hypothetical protein
MRKIVLKFILFPCILLAMASCDVQDVPYTKAIIYLSLPTDALEYGYDGYQVSLTNIATGRIKSITTDTTGEVQMDVEEGVYNIEVSGTKIVTTAEAVKTVYISGLLEKALMLGSQVEDTISITASVQSDGFVIKEIYYAGSTTPAKGSYYQDQFIEIYNNSDSVLYADGLTIVESTHVNSNAVNEYADSYPDDLIAGALYSVPGEGTEHPVQPGESLVIASLGINHQSVNANSPVDLSEADFEWYDAGTTDVDVPTVANMIRAFCYSNTIWLLHVKGAHAYALFKPTGTIADFVTENSVSVLTTSGSSVTRVKVSNDLILDGVDLGLAGVIGSKSLSSSIDIGFTYCDGSYIGKSVRRKVKEWVDGRAILQDTNNSTNDFISNATPKPWEVE